MTEDVERKIRNWSSFDAISDLDRQTLSNPTLLTGSETR